MTRNLWNILGAGVSGVLLAGAVAAYAAPPPAPPPNPNVPPPTKRAVERPTQDVLANTAAAARAALAAEANKNPKVEPGKVKWHKTFAEACQASAKSGKPVMLFQMMGKLDDQFC